METVIVPSRLFTLPVEVVIVKTRLLAAAALITMFPAVAEVSVPALTLNVYVPAVFRVRLEKVATPYTAFAVSVLPEAKPLLGPLCKAIVTVEVSDVTVLP